MKALALNTATPQLETSTDIADSLVIITEPVEGTSALPLDLGTTVEVLNSVIRYCKTLTILRSYAFSLVLQMSVEPLDKKSSYMYVFPSNLSYLCNVMSLHTDRRLFSLGEIYKNYGF